MKKKLLYLTFIVSVVFLSGFLSPPKKEKMVFFGDSITQAGVGKKGYITVLGELIKEKEVKKPYELIGAGISGNKVTDLYLRLENDVLKRKPSTVVIWIGVNDVWHKKGGTGTEAGTFEKFYELIIQKLQKKKVRVIMCTPGA